MRSVPEGCPTGEEQLAGWLAADSQSTALLLDFDGTVADIVPEPGRATAMSGIPELLGILAHHLATVAVISGRPLDFLEDRLAGAGNDVILVGLYGLEMLVDGKRLMEPGANRWDELIRLAHDEAWKDRPAGVFVEDKGLGFALHWRNVPELAQEALQIAVRLADAYGLELQPGRMAIELRVPVNVDKGSTVAKLADGRKRICYIGDDAGDLKAYDALDVLSRSGSVVLRVAVNSPEIPGDLLERADTLLAEPASVAKMLNLLVTTLAVRM
ncbi:MAG: trehalose-phosphatase [Actinobacteria bacterium]|nr:trehalose-phosphatase [Actinomycetota bacterium]MCL5445917.1 trehalose-phosphatase [Actinomycetota bacterium]